MVAGPRNARGTVAYETTELLLLPTRQNGRRELAFKL